METAIVTTDKDDIYKHAAEARGKQVEAILLSKSLKKVVVAGPGTGKTYLFKEILKGKKKTLTPFTPMY